MGERGALPGRVTVGAVAATIGVVLGRLTWLLWAGWWWPLTLVAAMWFLASGFFYFRAAWLGQSDTFK